MDKNKSQTKSVKVPEVFQTSEVRIEQDSEETSGIRSESKILRFTTERTLKEVRREEKLVRIQTFWSTFPKLIRLTTQSVFYIKKISKC